LSGDKGLMNRSEPTEQIKRSLNYFVGALQCRLWKVGTKRLGRLDVADELDLRQLLYCRSAGMARFRMLLR